MFCKRIGGVASAISVVLGISLIPLSAIFSRIRIPSSCVPSSRPGIPCFHRPSAIGRIAFRRALHHYRILYIVGKDFPLNTPNSWHTTSLLSPCHMPL